MDMTKVREMAERIAKEQAEIAAAADKNRESVREHHDNAQDDIRTIQADKKKDDEAVDPKLIEEAVREAMAPYLRTLSPADRDQAQRPGGEVDAKRMRKLILLPTQDKQVAELQRAAGDLYIARRLMRACEKMADKALGYEFEDQHHRFNEAARALGLGIRATTFGTTGSGTGDEFAFDEPSADLIEKIDIIGNIGGLFEDLTIPQGRESITLPREGSDPTVYTVGQSVTDAGLAATVSNPATAQVKFVVGKHSAYVMYSAEADEDLIIAAAQYVRNKLGKATMLAREAALISGDTASALDSDMSAGPPADRLAIADGFREKTITDFTAATLDMSALTAPSKIVDLRKLMGKYGVDPTNLVGIIPFNRYFDWVGNDEFKNLNEVGGASTLLTGVLGAVGGVQILSSQEFRQDINASGVFDGVTTTKHAILVVYRPGWCVVRKRELAIKVDDMSRIEFDQIKVVAHTRFGFQSKYADSENVAAYGYNFAN